MVIKKIYNNNILLVEDERQLEMILIGRGIAFQKKVGDRISQDRAEKRFVIDSPELTSRFAELVKEVPVNHLELACRIIEEAQDALEVKFSDAIYIGLSDHISYALHRYKQNLPLKNNLLWEIRRFYPREYEQAKKALKTIAYYENAHLPEDEAGYIALHFVNATQEGEEMPDHDHGDRDGSGSAADRARFTSIPIWMKRRSATNGWITHLLLLCSPAVCRGIGGE